jgi:hypothetical protein
MAPAQAIGLAALLVNVQHALHRFMALLAGFAEGEGSQLGAFFVLDLVKSGVHCFPFLLSIHCSKSASG